ncbi:MAG: terminase small subunit [Clostridia bacterium]|nr:terminase small subunit [Clostridia bacterium]
MSKLNAKERLFCGYYVITGNSKDAAAKAGYKHPEADGLKLLCRDIIINEINQLKVMQSQIDDKIVTGYERLAFGSVADAIRLMFLSDEMDLDKLDAMDLFNIAEIKRPKSGGIEIKFFDRQKALDKLCEQGKISDSRGQPFYDAIKIGAKNLKTNADDAE